MQTEATIPRNGSGVYSLPGTYEAVSGETIEAQQHNDPLEDLQQDANTPRPVVAGGTGSATEQGAIDAFFATARTIKDDKLLIVDPSDTTKRVRLDAGNVTAGQTRVLTAPNADGTILTNTDAASQAAMESEISTGFVRPVTVRYSPGVAKVWAHFGTSGNVFASYGVSSVTDNGTGQATVNQSTTMSASTGAILVSIYGASSLYIVTINSYTTTTVKFYSWTTSAVLTDPNEYFMARFGDI